MDFIYREETISDNEGMPLGFHALTTTFLPKRPPSVTPPTDDLTDIEVKNRLTEAKGNHIDWNAFNNESRRYEDPKMKMLAAATQILGEFFEPWEKQELLHKLGKEMGSVSQSSQTTQLYYGGH